MQEFKRSVLQKFKCSGFAPFGDGGWGRGALLKFRLDQSISLTKWLMLNRNLIQ